MAMKYSRSMTCFRKTKKIRPQSPRVAKLLNCTTEDVAILVSAGKLRALGKPRQNAVKFFSAVEMFALLADREWLDDATKTIGQFWRRKNARRNGLTTDSRANKSLL